MFTSKRSDPIINTISKATRNMSKEEANSITKTTTEEELAKLATHIAEKGLPSRSDHSEPEDSFSDSDDSDYNSDKAYKNRPVKKQKYNDISEKLYDDNQKLWEKIQSLSKKYEKIENSHRYLQLDYNNEIVKTNKLNDIINTSKLTIKKQKIKLFYNRIHTYTLDIVFISSVCYISYLNFSSNSIYLYFNSFFKNVFY